MTQETSALNTPAGRPLISGSRGLVDWLGSQNVSLAISTYQTGKLFLVGRNEDGRFSVFERTFERAMGLAGNDQTIYLATLYQEVDVRRAGRIDDDVATVAATGDLSRFVEADTRCIKARICFTSNNARRRFVSATDQFKWTITP